MPDYEQMYFSLCSAICNAIDSLEETNYGTAKQILIQAMQKTEELYIKADSSE